MFLLTGECPLSMLLFREGSGKVFPCYYPHLLFTRNIHALSFSLHSNLHVPVYMDMARDVQQASVPLAHFSYPRSSTSLAGPLMLIQ
jgi:hypothetical protein